MSWGTTERPDHWWGALAAAAEWQHPATALNCSVVLRQPSHPLYKISVSDSEANGANTVEERRVME